MARTVPEDDRADQAGAFAMLALLGYATWTKPDALVGVGCIDFQVKLEGDVATLARSIGRLAADIPLFEALHHITTLYAAMLPDRHRAAAGAFYTPPCLVERLLDLAEGSGMSWEEVNVLDPAAGGGAFLVQTACRMLSALGDCEPRFALRHLENRLRGFELDSRAAALAQVSLEIVLADQIKAAGAVAPAFVRVCDTLEEPPAAKYDLVVGNPPYGRVTLTSEARVRYSRSLDGHANLYGLFTDVALRWAKRGGRIAYLTPTSFLGGQYYCALRQLLAKEARPVALDFVHARKGSLRTFSRKPF